MGAETVKWQTRATYGCLVSAKVHGHGLSLWHIACIPALSVTQKCRCGLWRYTSVISLCLTAMKINAN